MQKALNIVRMIGLATIIVALMSLSGIANAQEAAEGLSILGKAVGAGLAIGLAGAGAGYAVGVAGAAAISATTEKPEMFGRTLIFVVLGEGIAIYGLLVAILIIAL